VIHQAPDKKLDVVEKPRHGNPDNSEVQHMCDNIIQASLNSVFTMNPYSDFSTDRDLSPNRWDDSLAR